MADPPGHPIARYLTLLSLLSAISITLAGATGQGREDIEIGIGGKGGGIGIGIGIGGGSSPSSSGPQPCDFENERFYRAYRVIQRFKKTITCDPKNITGSWTGTVFCNDCNYKGFYCDKPPNVTERTVASVDFNGYHLAAPTVAGFADQLSDIALFHANSNDLGGFVPNLRGLQYFYELDLSNNKLTPCTFPMDVLGLTNSTFVDIRFNSFYGTLPDGVFCSFPQVQAIFVNNNQFSGSLPQNLGNSPVNYLSLANNKFSGEIPKSIANAAHTLFEVLFLNNQLSGCLPYELGLLINATVIDAGTNMLTGPIPASFGCLRKVEQLNLANNLLYGEVPDALCQLAAPWVGHLMNLSLSGNYFTSVGPCCWELIKKKVLDVSRNCIPWVPNQRSAEECARFLHQRKTCPDNYYMPCHAPYKATADNDEIAAVATAATSARKPSRPAAYRTYTALHP